MSTRPLLLDLFCGAGGCAVGYHRAGFDVVGVDVKLQPRYPFAFCEGDAIELLRCLLRGGYFRTTQSDHTFYLNDFDAIHASPPCQHATTLKAMHKSREYPNVIPATRDIATRTGKLFVIENVVGAELSSPVILCGSMFGLGANCADGQFHQLRRHRLFECNESLFAPPCLHKGRPVGVYGNGGGNASRGYRKGVNGFTGKASERREAMGIDWMNRYELSQSIPPAYTEFIGRQLIKRL